MVRENDTAGDIIADWRIDPESPGSQYVMSDSLEGSVAFSDGEVGSSIILQIQNNWVDVLAVDPIDISVLLTSAGNGAHLAVDQARHSCVVRLIPGEEFCLFGHQNVCLLYHSPLFLTNCNNMECGVICCENLTGLISSHKGN